MGAMTTVWVKVVIEQKEWREMTAMNLIDARADAHTHWDDVKRVEESQYERPTPYEMRNP